MANLKIGPDKINLFIELFCGLKTAYGTENRATGKHWIAKTPVTEQVIADHLLGNKLFASFLLNKNKTKALVVDIDTGMKLDAFEFYEASRRHGLQSYIETSRAKGFHVWWFMERPISAAKARRAAKGILAEIERYANIEIFPKQDRLGEHSQYGNTINTPLFGGLTPKNKTVFVSPETFGPYKDQWALLAAVEKISEKLLDEVISKTKISYPESVRTKELSITNINYSNFSLLPCIQAILTNGVSRYQKSSCFWLAVHLKRIALPRDFIIIVLREWSQKNTPSPGRSLIKETGIKYQVECAYKFNNQGLGCSTGALSDHCDKRCRIHSWRKKRARRTNGTK